MVIAGLRIGFGCELNLRPETTMTDDRMALIELIEKGGMRTSCVNFWPLRPSA